MNDQGEQFRAKVEENRQAYQRGIKLLAELIYKMVQEDESSSLFVARESLAVIKNVEKTYTGAECLAFPFVVPGYGVIVDHSAWQVFLADYKFRCEAPERVTRHCQMQELEKEMEE